MSVDISSFCFVLQATIVAAITRTGGATATVTEALMHEVDITAVSSQGEATELHPLTTKEDTTRYLI